MLLPIWFVPGVLDWYWHRRTRIEDTAGARESVLHLLMEAEAGIPVAAFLPTTGAQQWTREHDAEGWEV